MKTYTLEQIKKMRGRTDWERLRRMKDKDIDFSDIPALSLDWVRPVGKAQVSLRLDSDVLGWFKRRGRGYQTRINAVLRAYVNAQKAARTPKKPSRRAA